MKYIKQFALIILMTFLGECLNAVLPLPIPASIYGMVLLFLCLQFGILQLSHVEETADLFLSVMPIFLISPTVSLMSSAEAVKESLFGIFLICVVSTFAVMVVTGLVAQWQIRRTQKRGGKINE